MENMHGGRAMTQAEKRIAELEKQLQTAKNNKERNKIKDTERNKIKDTMRRIRQDAEKKKAGVEHSHVMKR